MNWFLCIVILDFVNNWKEWYCDIFLWKLIFLRNYLTKSNAVFCKMQVISYSFITWNYTLVYSILIDAESLIVIFSGTYGTEILESFINYWIKWSFAATLKVALRLDNLKNQTKLFLQTKYNTTVLKSRGLHRKLTLQRRAEEPVLTSKSHLAQPPQPDPIR